jgi:signal transduction histidine kinase
MSTVGSERAVLRHPRLASLATREWPAWLWSADGSRILWANAAGAAIFGAATASACSKRRFDATELPAAQVIRLAATLPLGGQERLERLRGLGATMGRPLTCICSRIVAEDGRGAVLIAAAERAGPALTLTERVRRLFDDDDEAIAVFLPDGQLLYSNAAGHKRLGGATGLDTPGLETAATALLTGTATESTRVNGEPCEVLAARLGQESSTVLLVIMQKPAAALATPNAAANAAANATAMTAPGSGSGSERPAAPAAASAIASQSRARTVDPLAMPDRRHPLRFVWDMDADGRFTVASDEFIQLAGPRAALFGRPWREIAATLQLDPDDQVTRAVATRETWSGIILWWPVGLDRESDLRLPIELSGLPIFDRDRNFRGYRGFGVCRDLGRHADAPADREEETLRDSPAAVADQSGDREPAIADAPAAAAPPAAHPALANVVPFRPAAPAEPKTAPTLSPVERKAFRELAQELTSRLRGGQAPAPVEIIEDVPAANQARHELRGEAVSQEALNQEALNQEPPNQETQNQETLSQLELARVLSAALNQEPNEDPSQDLSQDQDQDSTEHPAEGPSDEPRDEQPELAAPSAGTVGEQALLDRIPIGVLVYRHDQLIYTNRHFLDLSGYADLAAIEADGGLNRLFAEPEPSAEALANRAGAQALANRAGAQALAIVTQQGDRLPVEGRMFKVPWSGSPAIALIITTSQGQPEIARQAQSAVEEELRDAKRDVLHTAAAKAEFVAKISHEIRTPLTAITGFAEAIMAERFGPIGSERYREYIKDIHAAGAHLSSLLHDLLDLSRIETGRIELTFANVNLNDLTQQCVGIMQPQANRARLIIRTALSTGLSPVMADERAVRQIVLNLLTNSIRFTGPGGQIIVSTALSDAHEAVLRVRDTSAGMSEKDIEAALEPFRDIATAASWGSGGTGFGLPLTKALAEANHAHFRIKSAPDAGTLIEIAFPPNRLVAA